ncbi:hypothetical protein HDC93_001532 [Streptomyces sp. AK010]|nr:hypothetical protein [Streptomyces sp. AK010]
MAAIPSGTRGGHGGPGNSEGLSGASLFAGAVMMLSGPLSISHGASGIAKDNLFAASQYAYRFDST